MRALAFAMVLLMAACTETTQSEEPTAPPPLSVLGTNWVMNTAGEAAAAPTIAFAQGGRASGFSGCNQWFAQFDNSAGALSFSGVGMTRRACPEPEMTTERDFSAMLAATRGARIEGETLTLLGANAEQLGSFRRTR